MDRERFVRRTVLHLYAGIGLILFGALLFFGAELTVSADMRHWLRRAADASGLLGMLTVLVGIFRAGRPEK